MLSLLKVFSPNVIPRKTNDWNAGLRLYRWILILLYKLYCKGAISDIIYIDNIKVLHTVRDDWYENELHRFNIKLTSQLETSEIPPLNRTKYHRSSIFTWSETLQVLIDKNSYNIKRNKQVNIDTDINGQLRISNTTSDVYCTEFTIKTTIHTTATATAHSISRHNPKSKLKHKISVKDSTPITNITMKDKPISVKFRGFEENSIF